MKDKIIMALVIVLLGLFYLWPSQGETIIETRTETVTVYDTVTYTIHDTIYVKAEDFQTTSKGDDSGQEIFTYVKDIKTEKDGQEVAATVQIRTHENSLIDVHLDWELSGDLINKTESISNTLEKTTYKIKGATLIGAELVIIGTPQIFLGIDFLKDDTMVGVAGGFDLITGEKMLKLSYKRRIQFNKKKLIKQIIK